MLTINAILDAASKCSNLNGLQRLVNRVGRQVKAALVSLCQSCNLPTTGSKGELLFRLEGVLSEMYLKAGSGSRCYSIA